MALLAVLVVVALAVMLPNLGNQYLWQDEAQTALISRTVIEHGVPLGYDGRNHFSQEMGAEYGPDYVWRFHNWLPFYLLASFFALFGESTFVARLPFALCGVATVAAVYLSARSLWRSSLAALVAGGLLCFSIPFLILSRQCRYYSAASLLVMLAMMAYCSLTAGRRHAGPLFALCAGLLFHTHYMHCLILMSSLWAHALIWNRRRLRSLLLWSGVVALVSLPWYAAMSGMGHFEVHGESVFHVGKAIELMSKYLSLLLHHAFHPALLAVPALAVAAALIRRRPQPFGGAELWNPLSMLLLLISITLMVMSVGTPAPWLRNIAPLLPLLAVVAGRIAIVPGRLRWLLGGAVVALMVGSGPLPGYFAELTEDYEGPIEGIVRYLQRAGEPDDVVAITYGDLPIKFYTEMRVVGCDSGEDVAEALKADWIIIRSRRGERAERFSRFLMNGIDQTRYRLITLPVVDTYWENREEPRQHRFRTATSGPPVRILRKIDG
jgi:4-amino-4-deoxy-L-arabinose transferase-like glycosyltransferase